MECCGAFAEEVSTTNHDNLSYFCTVRLLCWRCFVVPTIHASKLGDADLREGFGTLGVKLTRREARRLIAAAVNDGTVGSPSSVTHRIGFEQFLRLLDGGEERKPLSARSNAGNQEKRTRNTPSATPTSRTSKGVVTFHDGTRAGDMSVPSPSRTELRASLRRLVDAESGGPSAGKSVGPGLRDRLKGALKATAEASGAKSARQVDREIIRRAMIECGAPLNAKLLGDLKRRFDLSGTGDIDAGVRLAAVTQACKIKYEKERVDLLCC